MSVQLDPEPDRVLNHLYGSDPHIAARIDECIDWIDTEPMDPRAYRRMFSNGIRAITREVDGEEWQILWEPDGSGIDVVRFIGNSSRTRPVPSSSVVDGGAIDGKLARNLVVKVGLQPDELAGLTQEQAVARWQEWLTTGQ